MFGDVGDEAGGAGHSVEHAERVRIAANDDEPAAGAGNDLGDENAEGAGAEDGDVHPRLEADLARDLEGGGQRLNEDGLLVGERVGQDVAVAGGDYEALGEGAVAADDADDGAPAAVVGEAGAAHVALAA